MIEYSVIWKRQHQRKKRKVFVHRATAERLLALLTSPEPWTIFGKTAEEEHYPEGGGGENEREANQRLRERLPKLEYARVEGRYVGEWFKPAATCPHCGCG